MNIWLVRKMVNEYKCIHEEQLQGQSRKIAELETRSNYKEKMFDSLDKKIDKLDKKLDKIDHCVYDLQIQSQTDDFNIDSRVTQLETTQSNQKWAVGIGLSALTTAVSILAFLVAHLH